MTSPASSDVGLGTAYERLAIYQLMRDWLAGYKLRRAVEGPVDGMAGIPGLHLVGLARLGTTIRVEHSSANTLERVRAVYRHLGLESQLELNVSGEDGEWEGGFDLALTYNALPLVRDWRGYLRKVAARSGRYLVVSVTNPASYGVSIRKLMRRLETDGAPELFDHPSCRHAELEPELRRLGRIRDHLYLDCPWWPDLFVQTGETLLSGTLRRIPWAASYLERQGGERGAGFLYGPDVFPLFNDHPEHLQLRKAMRRHPVFDRRGRMLGRLFGHHHAYLVEKGES